MRFKTRWLMFVGATVFALALLWWFTHAPIAGSTPRSAAPVRSDVDKASPLVRDPERHASAADSLEADPVKQPSPASARLLPPTLDATIASYLEEEDRRAAAGDRQAACRLGFDLALCAETDELREAEESFSRSAMETSLPRAQAIIVEHLSLIRENIGRAEKICKDLTPQQIASSWKYLARAAELGDHDAAIYFVSEPPLSASHFLTDFEGWTYYRNNYERLLQRGVAAGNPQALFLSQRLAFGLPPITPLDPLSGDLQEDPMRGLTYSLVLARFADVPNAAGFERNAARARASLSAAQIRAAHHAADVMYERSFKRHSNLDFESGPTRDFDAKKCYD